MRQVGNSCLGRRRVRIFSLAGGEGTGWNLVRDVPLYGGPRFVDKARAFLDGSLPREYRAVLGNRRGVDGQFLQHFELTKDGFLDAVREHGDDEAIERWFGGLEITPEQIEAWNRLAPELGRPGTAMADSFARARRLYPDTELDDDVDTVFEAICVDEDLPYPPSTT